MKAYTSIDDGAYPTFNLTKDKVAGVEIPTTRAQVLKWKSAFALYAAAQREIEALVNHYQPAALKK